MSLFGTRCEWCGTERSAASECDAEDRVESACTNCGERGTVSVTVTNVIELVTA